MLKSRLERFVAKRVLIFFVILAILDIVLFDKRWLVLCGLLTGGAFGIFRFGSYAVLFTRLLAPLPEGSTMKRHAAFKSTGMFIINQSVLLLLLYLAFKISSWFFAGIVAGIMLVPFVLTINGVTEALKITNNNFE